MSMPRTNLDLQPDPRRSIGDLLNAIAPVLEANGWDVCEISDDGLTASSAGSPVRIWLDYDESTPVVGPPAGPNRFAPDYLRAIRRAVESYDERRRMQ